MEKQKTGNLSVAFSKPASRFVGEMLYGIASRQSVLLSEIVRSLGEPIPQINTENRLSSGLRRVIRQYMTRWQIEETIRYAKQGYGLENARARKYEAFRNLFAIALAVVYFATAWLGQYARHGILARHAIRRRGRDIAQTRLAQE